jgi:WD40 repeat protein
MASRVHADETPIAAIEHPEPVDFQREILPILRKKCLACHNGTDAESDLVLETPETILKGGLEGPAVVAGAPDESRMLALASARSEPAMPPEDNDAGAERLTSEELGLLKIWIEQGAKGAVTTASESIDWHPLPSAVNPVYAAAQSPDGRFVVVGRANQAWVYDLLLGQYVDQLIDPSLTDSPVAQGHPIAHMDLVQSLVFSHDGLWIASGGYRTLKIWRRHPVVEHATQLNVSNVTATAQHGDTTYYLADGSGRIRAIDAHGAQIAGVAADHGSRIHSLAVSPNGKRLASTGEDNTVRVWTDTGEVGGSQAQSCRVQQLTWIDDNLLAGACDDHMVRVWTVDPSGALADPRLLAGHAQPVTAITRLGTSRVVSASHDGNVRIWDVASGQTQRELNHGAAVSGLAAELSAEPKRLVTLGGGAAAKLWNLESGELVAELSADVQLQWQHQQRTLALQIAKRHIDNVNQDIEAAKKRITEEEQNLAKDREARDKAKAELDKAKEPADAAERERQAVQETLDASKAKLAEAEKAAAEASDEEAKKTAATQIEAIKKEIADAENTLKAKSEAVEKAAKQLAEQQQAFETAEQSIANSERAVSDAKAAAEQLTPQLQAVTERQQVVEQEAKHAEAQLQAERHAAQRAIMSSDGTLIASVDRQGKVALWRADDGRPIQIASLPADQVVSLAFGEDRHLWALTADGNVFAVGLSGQWRLAQIVGAPDDTSILADRVTALSFSPDDQLLAIGGGQPSRGGELKLFRVENGELVREIVDAHSDTIFGLAFSPDGQQLASCGADRFMKVFDVASGNLVRTFEGHTHHVLSVSWRADGRVIATGGADSVVKLWNVADGSQLRTIQGFAKEVTSVQFAGAEDHFYAACGDQNLYRCNLGGERKSIGRGQDFLYVVSTNLLGKSVAFAGHDSVVRVIDDSGTSLAELKPQ